MTIKTTPSLARRQPPVYPAAPEPNVHDPRQLILGVTRSALPSLRLHVLAERQIVDAELELCFRIIGESHWISVWRRGTLLLHEILACVPIMATHCTIHQPFARVRRCRYRHQGYAVQVAFQPMSERIAELGRDSEHLDFYFPTPSADRAPFTRIWWTRDERGWSWQTTHVYSAPEGTTAVLSRSYLERSALQ